MLADKIKLLRKQQRMSQAELAKRAKVSQQLITKIETGAVRETRKLPQIARALGLTVEQMLNDQSTIREPTSSYHGVQLTRSGALLAAEWEKLDVSDRAEIEGEILARVGRRVRGSRARDKIEKSAKN